MILSSSYFGPGTGVCDHMMVFWNFCFDLGGSDMKSAKEKGNKRQKPHHNLKKKEMF